MHPRPQFADQMAASMKKAELPPARLLGSVDNASAMYAEATFQVGTATLRFVSDRGQTFLDVGSVSTPDIFHQFVDVEVAMGWRTLDSVLEMKYENIDHVLSKLNEHFIELSSALSPNEEQKTQKDISKACELREKAAMRRLRSSQRTGE